MASQVLAIVWAQFRIFRNRLPRTHVGSVLAGLLGLLWYGIFIAVGISLAVALPHLPAAQLHDFLPTGLLGVFLFWQIVPLFTLSTGWSLQLNKLQMYPVSNSAFFGIEVLLRISTAPEMIFVLLGGLAGLLRYPGSSLLSPFFILLFIPVNLFLSLAVREVVLHSFERNRFRELFAVLLISISVLPQLALRTGLGRRLSPYFFSLAHSPVLPWQNVATLSLGSFSPLQILCLLFWLTACYWLARLLFVRSLHFEETARAPALIKSEQSKMLGRLSEVANQLFRDPVAALLQKELQSLVRMPRFRVTFGMACVFSVLVFLPIAWNNISKGADTFVSNNFLSIVTLYGVLILSDLLLLNIFGLDRNAAQSYFVAPISLEDVIRAKNLAAIIFLVIQSVMVLFVVLLIRIPVTAFNITGSVIAAAVVGLFFISAGNLSSVFIARPSDPRQTFKKQSGGKMQFWLLLCSIGMFVLLGAAFLAQWALRSDWALLGVLAIEFVIGLVVYRIALDSATERAWRERERLLDTLSKGSSPIGFGS